VVSRAAFTVHHPTMSSSAGYADSDASSLFTLPESLKESLFRFKGQRRFASLIEDYPYVLLLFSTYGHQRDESAHEAHPRSFPISM
jgi:hypothetical protein